MTTRRALLAAGAAGAGGLLLAPGDAGARAVTQAERGLSWRRLSDLPPNRVDWAEEIPVGEPFWRQLGLAGPVAGSDGDH
jgi:N-acetylneuraminate epimerase